MRSRILTLAAASFILGASCLAVRAFADPVPLTSTGQYKEFSRYVIKLANLRSQPATEAQKTIYNEMLTSKFEDVKARAQDISNRIDKKALADTQDRLQIAIEQAKQAEIEQLNNIDAQTSVKLDQLASDYDTDVYAISAKIDSRVDQFKQQIAALKKKLRKTKKVAKQKAIQKQINSLQNQLLAAADAKTADLEKLSENYKTDRAAIKAHAKAAKTRTRDNAKTNLKRLHVKWNNIYQSRKTSIKNRLAEQIESLSDKLQKGRDYIGSMPVSY